MSFEPKDFMDMLKNKEQVITSILKDFDSCSQNMAAFEKLEQLFADGKEVKTEKVLAASAKSLRHLNDMNRRLLMLLLVYSSSNNYSSDVAQVLVKFGQGEEALQEIFRQKMSGKG